MSTSLSAAPDDAHLRRLLEALRVALSTLMPLSDSTLSGTQGPRRPRLHGPDELLALLSVPQTLPLLDACLDPARVELRERFLEVLLSSISARLGGLHQFVEVDAALGRELARAGLRGLRELQTASREGTVNRSTLESLGRRWRQRMELLLRQGLALERPGAAVDAPVCAQYRPETQLVVLGLRVESLLEPVLDLGCGGDGRLVGWLRAREIAATGVDRHLSEGQGLERGDWMSWPLGVERWGTIISHMAFSNHFIHHHLHPQGRASAWAQRYVALLAALKPGGRFVYAPGLPFIEGLLDPERYLLTRLPIVALAEDASLRAVAARLGAEVSYASQVTRRAEGPGMGSQKRR